MRWHQDRAPPHLVEHVLGEEIRSKPIRGTKLNQRHPPDSTTGDKGRDTQPTGSQRHYRGELRQVTGFPD